MPRRSPRNEEVSDSLAGSNTEALGRRNPRRGTQKPVVYREESQGDAESEESDDVHMADGAEKADDDDAIMEEPEESDSLDYDEEEVAPRKRSSNRRRSSSDVAEPSRKSSRSNKFTSSMAEQDNNDLLFDPDEEPGPAEPNGSDEPTAQERKPRAAPDSPHKSPARRHSEKRRTIQDDEDYSDEEDAHEDEDEDLSHAEDDEPLRIQRIIASRTERRTRWREIGASVNTSEITDGSRWIQNPSKSAETDDTFEERFLVKWSDLSFLHCSWESRRDLLDQVEGAKPYFSTFFKKSQDGYLFTPEERNDGDYFDPAYTQIDRILEVTWPDGVDPTGPDEEAQLKPEDVGVTMDRDDDNGTGRQFLIKWGNQPYSEATYEFERDLIWNDIDYKSHVEAFLRRNNKPSKRARSQAISAGKQEVRKLFALFNGSATEEEHDKGIKSYQEGLLQLEFKNGGQLRDYQAEGVAWMLSNFVSNRSSILADEMGLGKTLQVVTTTNIISTKISPTGVFLVVAPLSTLAHWKREFESWTDLNTIIYHGSAEDRDQIRQYEMAYECDRPSRVAFNSLYLKKCGPKKYEKADSPWMVQVIITTPEMLTADDASELMAIKYDVVVIDEAHRMKNRNSKLTAVLNDHRFSFNHKVLLTGTPIQNNVSEFWTLLNFCDENAYGDLDEFLEKYGDMKDKETVDELHNEIRPYILRRLKEDVEKSVPPKEETIIEVELTMPQKQYYRALYEKNVKFLYKNKSKALDGPSLNNLAMQLRKCCNHVCLLNGVEEELRRDHPDLDEAGLLVKGSGKLVLLDKLLPRLREEGHRVLLFSQFKIMLDLLEDYLIDRGMKMERIDGSITGQKRQQAIDRFQAKDAPKGTEPPFIMLLSTRAGGQGITLTAADTCIIFDSDWNPQNDLQAQARCHRIGQTSEVKVYRLISAKSYEKQMFHLASLKMGLDQAVLRGFEKGGATDAGMSKEEVERLLKHGAYDILNEEKAGTAEAASNEFIEQDIDSILAGRSRTIVHENTGSQSGAAGGTFSKASFQMTKTPGKDKNDAVDLDDPNFWAKILGEEHLKEAEDDYAFKKRQRSHTNYNEAAYHQRLDAALVGEEPPDENSQGQASDSEDDDADTEKVSWTKSRENDWSLREAESLSECLHAFGYGNLQWDDVIRRLGLKDISLEEVKRMAFSMVLSSVVEATESEISASKKREEKSAEIPKEVDGETKAQLTDEQIEKAAFRKFWDPAAEWVGKLSIDVALHAKDNEARDADVIMELLNKKDKGVDKEEVKVLFARNVWAPLRSRGWKATILEGSAPETQYSYGEEKYNSIEEVLEAARNRHSELSEVIESVSNAVAVSKARSKETQMAKRRQVQSFSPVSASLELIKTTLHLYGPAQLIVDRRKYHPKVRLTRKIITSCVLMSVAFDFFRKAESLTGNGSTVEKISKHLYIDKRSSLPHPKWTTFHDAVLINAIVKHGWLDSDSSCRAIKEDTSMQWGLPFDRSRTATKADDEQSIPPTMVQAVAERACTFLNANKVLLSSSKTFHDGSLVRAYWLEKSRPAGKGDSLADASSHEQHYEINRKALLQELTGANAELSELPTRKEMLKRAKTVFSRATIGEGASIKDEPKQDHSLTVVDQSNPCNVFLAQLIRNATKAPALGELFKVLAAAAIKEAAARKNDIQAFGQTLNSRLFQEQRSDLEKIAEQIDTAKRSMYRSVRLSKNVLRAMIGEELAQSKNPNDPLLPNISPRLKVVPASSKQEKAGKLSQGTARKIDKRLTFAEFAVTEARKFINSNKYRPDTTVDLTEVETAILQTASSFGIPQYCVDWRDEFYPLPVQTSLSRFTWSDFGRRLVATSKTRMEEIAAKRDKANRDYESLVDSPGIPSGRRDSIERTAYLAEMAFESCEVAKGQAEDYAGEPETLAKKTIMTLSKASNHAGVRLFEKGSASAGLCRWLLKEVEIWGKELELIGENGKVLALTAQDFLKELSEAERSNVQAAAAFDGVGCSQLVRQIALVSRLGAFLRNHRHDPDSVQACVTQAAMDKNWPDRPSWWSEDSADFDLLLLKRLVESGFDGLMTNRSNYGLDNAYALATYKSGGPPKGSLLKRAMVLGGGIHGLDRQVIDRNRTFFSMTSDGKISSVLTEENHSTPPAAKKARATVS